MAPFAQVLYARHDQYAGAQVVLVAPRHCTRAAFFGSFVARLEATPTIGAGRVMPVRDAYTPVIKLRVGETDVDLLFVALDAAELPAMLNVLDDGLLRGLDEGAIRSLNGVRVAEMLLRLVPNVDVFRLALRAVKLWARAKGLYSNVLGLLGGVNCAILVAFVCQRYPNAAASTIVGRFFRIFDSWDWPNPVLIAPPAVSSVLDVPATTTPKPPQGQGGSAYVAWNPRLNPRDRAHLAPIVTPAHPTMNSSYNIGEPQLQAIREELKLGVETTRRVERLVADMFHSTHAGTSSTSSSSSNEAPLNGVARAPSRQNEAVEKTAADAADRDEGTGRSTASANSGASPSIPTGESGGEPATTTSTSSDLLRMKSDLAEAWRELFSPSDFFVRHRHYVQVDVSASDDDTLRRWFAWCESRLRGLVVALDTPGYVRARPHATPIERRDPFTDRKTRSFFVALSFEGHVQHIDLTPCVRDFSARVNAWEHRSEDMDLELKHAPQDELPHWVLTSQHFPLSWLQSNQQSPPEAHQPHHPNVNFHDGSTTIPSMGPPTMPLYAANHVLMNQTQESSALNPAAAPNVETDYAPGLSAEEIDDDQETHLADDEIMPSYPHQEATTGTWREAESRHNAPTPPPIHQGDVADDTALKLGERRRHRDSVSASQGAVGDDTQAGSTPSNAPSDVDEEPAADEQAVPPVDQVQATEERPAVTSPNSSPAKKPRSEVGQPDRAKPAQMSYAQALLTSAGPPKRQVHSSS